MGRGKVYVAGAGPGDPKLLTLRVLEIFKVADVVLYDRLVSDEILSLLPQESRKINVGKKARCQGITQDEINRLMIEEAKAGFSVLRLKGGDPMFFSRGEEEIEALEEEGIEYEIVPGISSALGVASFAGIPLTRRRVSSSIALVSGHENPSGPEDAVDFQKLASSVDTIVTLMGAHNVRRISEQLVSGGARPETPVAIVESGTLRAQKIQFCTLADILNGELKDEIKSPMIMVVGDVVELARLREQKKHNLIQERDLKRMPVAWCMAAEFS